jgi:hypothetical protein
MVEVPVIGGPLSERIILVLSCVVDLGFGLQEFLIAASASAKKRNVHEQNTVLQHKHKNIYN